MRGHAAFAFLAMGFRSTIRNARALPPDERTRLKVVFDRGSRIIRFLFFDGEAEKAQSRCVAWLSMRLSRLLAAEPPLHAPETGPSGKLKRYLLPTDMRDASPLALHYRSKLWTAATTFIFSLVFYSIDVFGRKVKDWRQLCVHFPARVQPARLQLLAVGGKRPRLLKLHGEGSLIPASA